MIIWFKKGLSECVQEKYYEHMLMHLDRHQIVWPAASLPSVDTSALAVPGTAPDTSENPCT